MSREPVAGQELSLFHRSAAAAGASVVSAIVVNPLDVAKTRMQAQAATNASSAVQRTATRATPPASTLLEKWNFAGCGPECVRTVNPALPPSACGPACEPPAPYRGTWHTLRAISKREGVAVLWRGTDLALMMAIPMVGIYLPLYDYLVDGLRQRGAGMYAPLLAGTLARTAAGYATSPFELARTRMQAVRAVPLETHAAGYAVASASARGSAGAAMLRHLPSLQGAATTKAIGTLWTGVGATLARDVPFSALYWAMVEPIRQGILPADGASSETEVVVANAVAGATAGALAGSITTPLDVVKTRTQLAANASATASGSVWSTLRDITKNEGVAGLFRGWSARSAKAAPACAIVLSAYEMLKFWHPGGKQQ